MLGKTSLSIGLFIFLSSINVIYIVFKLIRLIQSYFDKIDIIKDDNLTNTSSTSNSNQADIEYLQNKIKKQFSLIIIYYYINLFIISIVVFSFITIMIAGYNSLDLKIPTTENNYFLPKSSKFNARANYINEKVLNRFKSNKLVSNIESQNFAVIFFKALFLTSQFSIIFYIFLNMYLQSLNDKILDVSKYELAKPKIWYSIITIFCSSIIAFIYSIRFIKTYTMDTTNNDTFIIPLSNKIFVLFLTIMICFMFADFIVDKGNIVLRILSNKIPLLKSFVDTKKTKQTECTPDDDTKTIFKNNIILLSVGLLTLYFMKN